MKKILLFILLFLSSCGYSFAAQVVLTPEDKSINQTTSR